jgi:hypothetical protein
VLVAAIGVWACGEQSLELGEASSFHAGTAIGSAPVASFDARPALEAPTPVPPIAGGTLHVTSDGTLAIAADRDRDTVSAVDLETATIAWAVNLDPSDRPGRIVESSDGRLHLALRGAGDILTLERTGVVVARTRACADPTGIAYSDQRSALLVACRDGSLLTVDPVTRVVTTASNLGPDLRDVVVMQEEGGRGEATYVTRFRSAELMQLDDTLGFQGRKIPESRKVVDTVEIGRAGQVRSIDMVAMEANVAWRAAPSPRGMVLLHQRSRRRSIQLDSEDGANDAQPAEGDVAPSTGAYGPRVDLMDDCSPVVGPAVTFVSSAGKRSSSRQLPGHLVVDVAESQDGWVALAEAGPPDPFAPTAVASDRAKLKRENGLDLPRGGLNVPVVLLYRRHVLDGDGCQIGGSRVTVPEYNQAVAVAFNPALQSRLLVLLRQPAELLLVDLEQKTQEAVALSERTVEDTGHALFHQASPAGIACANCHPEGGEDGRVWLFNENERRRTQPLDVGLADTAPFHWRGELVSVSSLVREVLTNRMGSALQSDERLLALESWLDQLESPAPLRDPTDALALEGKAVFESPEVGCASCHTGPAFTDNRSYDVGTGEVLQVPSLVGVAYRSPLMHDGCAGDLWARFEPSCGGSNHGATSMLTVEQLGALVAYLETL